MVIQAATRASALARWQTNHVAQLLAAAGGPQVEPQLVSTAGDRDKTTPLHQIGGKGIFVKEVQARVLDGSADIAVHSAKDLPALTPDGLVICAVPPRADFRDCLVGSTLDGLAEGATVGTGSVRRQVQLLQHRPDLELVEIRGNIDTRLGLVGELDAVIIAAAALDRLEITPPVAERLSTQMMLPQVGQGTLAVECRADDTETIEALSMIDDAPAHRILDAERSFLVELGGDCDLPAGAFAELVDAANVDGELRIRAMLSDGSDFVHYDEASGIEGEALGRLLAIDLRERLG